MRFESASAHLFGTAAPCLVAACVLGASPAGPAAAQEPEGACVSDVRRAFDAGGYERAFELLAGCAPPTTREARIEYLRVRGMVAYGLASLHPDAERLAREAFEELLQMDPHARLPQGTAPRFELFLARVRIEAGLGRPSVRLLLRAPTDDEDALMLELRGDTVRVGGVLVWLREPGGEYRPAPVACDADRCRVGLPEALASEDPPSLEGYAVAHAPVAERLHWLGNLGTAEAPFLFERTSELASCATTEARAESISPWVWAGLGAAAVAAVLTIVLVTTSGPTYDCAGAVPCFELGRYP